MRVLHILDHSLPAMSGYSTRSHNIVTFQRRLGLQPVVVTSPKHPGGGPPCEMREGIPYYRTQRSARKRPLPYASELALMARFARRIGDVARAEGVKVLHAHSPVLNGLPSIWAARRLGLPAVYESRAFWEDAAVDHGTTRENSVRYRVTRALETLAFRQASRVVVIAHAMRREIIGRGIAADRIYVVPNGVDADRFSPAPRDEALAQRLSVGGGPVFGFIGSFYHYEGLRFLVETFPALRERIPGAQLLLVGGGEDEAALRAAAVDGVLFAGQVPYNRVTDYYSLIDVFVCPRRRMRLTELVTPLKPLEAMAAGLPVLASDVGGLAELIEHDSTGLLFRAGDATAFLREAVNLASDSGLRARLGAGAREHVRSERAWDRVVSRYPTIYGLEPAAAAVIPAR
jgi:PEP-CTERM/exosortase A-associated glycosyltransferase